MATQTAERTSRDVIVQANEKWMDTYRRHDAAGMAQLYAGDGEVLPPNSDVVRGRQAIQQLFQGFFDAGIRMIELHTGEVEQHGDTAIEVSTATLRGEGDQLIDGAKYIVIWKRQGGEWKMHRDIFNLNSPAK